MCDQIAGWTEEGLRKGKGRHESLGEEKGGMVRAKCRVVVQCSVRDSPSKEMEVRLEEVQEKEKES